MGPNVMAFGVTNLGVVLVPYPPNSEESQKARAEGLRGSEKMGVRLGRRVHSSKVHITKRPKGNRQAASASKQRSALIERKRCEDGRSKMQPS